MTEADWLGWYEPGPLIHYLRSKRHVHRRVWGGRKLRLVAVAVCRTAEQFYASDEEAIARVELAERVADGPATERALKAFPSLGATSDPAGNARRATSATIHPGEVDAVTFAALYAALAHRYAAKGDANFAEREALRAQSDILRDIFGNPFRPATFDPAWRTDTTLSLARQMYESRDFSPMPILADALQDAGCTSDDVLSHCRGPGPHIRGCWVVDLVLGKA